MRSVAKMAIFRFRHFENARNRHVYIILYVAKFATCAENVIPSENNAMVVWTLYVHVTCDKKQAKKQQQQQQNGRYNILRFMTTV